MHLSFDQLSLTMAGHRDRGTFLAPRQASLNGSVQMPTRPFHGILAGTLLAALSACSTGGDLTETPEPIGEFKLGHVVVFADKAQVTPASRKVEPDEIEAAIKKAVKERMGRYTGRKFYHISVRVDAYQLGVAGIPVIASPRSAFILRVGLWDDATATQLNEELHTLTVLEPTSGETIIGSGHTRTKEEQLEAMAVASAELIEFWLKSDESPLAESDPADGNPLDEAESIETLSDLDPGTVDSTQESGENETGNAVEPGDGDAGTS